MGFETTVPSRVWFKPCCCPGRVSLFVKVQVRFARAAFQQAQLRRSAAGLDDSVGEIVTKRHRDGQRLHLLRGHHPAEGHPAQVLQSGDATRTLPEVHAAIASPATTISE